MKWTLSGMIACMLFGIGPLRLDAQVLLECRNGESYRDGSSVRMRCTSPNGVGVAVDVPPSPNVYENNPPCSQPATERVVRSLLSAATAERTRSPAGTATEFRAFWTSLKARVSAVGSGGEMSDLLSGVARGRGASVCQAFVVPVKVPATRIGSVEFRAGQEGQAGNVSSCFSARLSSSGAPAQTQERRVPSSGSVPTQQPLAVSPSTGACPIGWSGWEAAVAIPDRLDGTLIGAVFKNWSQNLTRSAELWVWFLK